jgi:hypothetical protein
LKSIFDAAFAEHLRGFMVARLPLWRGKEEVYMKITVFKAAGDTFALSERPNGSNSTMPGSLRDDVMLIHDDVVDS